MAAPEGLELVGVMGGEPLFSPRWYRVCGIKPQLRPQVELRRQDQRGVDWYLLVDETTAEVRRLNRQAYEFVGRLDGVQTVQQVWDTLLGACPDGAMTQDEVVRLLIALHERGLLEFDISPDVESIFRNRDRTQRRQRLAGVNPLAFRFSLVDPSCWLARLQPMAPWLFSRLAFVLWSIAVCLAGMAAATHHGELFAHGQRLLSTPRDIFLAWLMYPIIKVLHETAHGLAVQRWGGRVREAGIALMMLTPVPYVDVSAADGLRHRHQRAMVSAAGIMAELAVAALAMAVWLAVEPGLVRDIALLAMLIGTFSTVLVNGNPLMRFDGYYLLCDVLDLRNLGLRSTAWWQQCLSRRLPSAAGTETLTPLPGEKPWLVAYLPLATTYRTTLSLGIGFWIGGHSALLGAVVGGFIFWTGVVTPLRSAWRAVVAAGRQRGAWRAAGLAVAAVVALAFVPLPFSTLAQGVVWLPERAQVRAGTDGFIASWAAADGEHVKAGQLIATLTDNRLDATRATLAVDTTELEVAMFSALSSDPDKVPALREKLAYRRAEAARNNEKIALLEVRAKADGVLVAPQQADQLGSFRKRGAMIGHLFTADSVTVRVALPQDDAELLRRQGAQDGRSGEIGQPVGVRLAEEGWRLRPGTLRHDLGVAVSQLPSAALGEAGGGDLPTDPADKDGLTTLDPVVLMDVEVGGVRADALGDRIGARAVVRFDHGMIPIAQRVLRRVQQLGLAHFNPAG